MLFKKIYAIWRFPSKEEAKPVIGHVLLLRLALLFFNYLSSGRHQASVKQMSNDSSSQTLNPISSEKLWNKEKPAP